MTNYRKVADLPLTDAAYIAGLIDGEDTITLSRRHANENRQLVISISNNEKPLLDYVLTTVGAEKITNKRKSQAHHADSYNWSISNQQALDLLEQITGYLKTYKSRRADLIVEKYKNMTPRNGKYTGELLTRRHQFEQDVLSIKP
jgi:vacuolar-type H+-ATPase catalytic subunit A/Vma1